MADKAHHEAAKHHEWCDAQRHLTKFVQCTIYQMVAKTNCARAFADAQPNSRSVLDGEN